MRTENKKTLLSMAFATALLFTAGGVYSASAPYAASADTVTAAEVAVRQSASLRIDNFGMRFKTTVDKTYAANVSEVHTLLIPTAMLDGAELTAATEGVMDKTLDDAKKYEKGNDYYYNSVLTSIPKTQYGTEVSMRAYVITNDNQTVYSENTVSTSVAYLANATLALDYDTYAADLAQYLVKGIAMENTAATYNVGNTGAIGATIEYFDETNAELITKLNAKYALSYESANKQIAIVDDEGTVTAVSRGSTQITVTLKDGETTLDSKTFTVNVAQPKWGQVFDFEYPSLKNVSLEATVTNNPETSKGERTFGSDANGNYVQIKMPNSQYVNTRFHNIKLDDYKAFDKATVRLAGYYLNADGTKATANLNMAYMNAVGDKSTEYVSVSGDNTLRTYSADRSNANFDTVLTDTNGDMNYFRILIRNWGGYMDAPTNSIFKTMVVRFYGVDFTYADIALNNEDKTSVNLTEELSLTAQELSNVKFNGTAVTDITNFAATQNGTLTFDVVKEGYAPTSMSVNVTYTELKDLNRFLLDDTSSYASVTAVNGTTTYPVNKVTVGNYNALQTQITGSYPWLKLQDESLKVLADFDYFTLRYKVSYSVSGGSVGLKGTTGDVYNGADTTVTQDGWTLATWQKNGKRPQVFEYIKANGKFEISIYAWNGSETVTTLTVAEIVGGYNDITSDGATAIDLTSKFNATAAEMTTATFTPTGGTATAITDKAAFTPTENGVLTVTIKKAGYKAITYTLNVTVSTGA